MSRTIRISENTYKDLDERGTTSDSFDDVIQRLLGKNGESEGSISVDGAGNEAAPSIERPNEYTAVVTNKEGTARFAARTQAQVMQEVSAHLIDEHDLLDRIPLPYRTNGKQAILAADAHHPNGDDMRNPYEVSGKAYVETGIDKGTKQRYLNRLADECDVDVLFGPEWSSR